MQDYGQSKERNIKIIIKIGYRQMGDEDKLLRNYFKTTY